MAAITINQGLDRIAINASQAVGWSSSRYIRTMSVDDNASAFLSTDTRLDRAGALTIANSFDAALDATPAAPASRVVSHTMTIPTGSGNFTIRRIALHDDTPANVSPTSTTLCAGIDGQTLAKTSDFSLAITETLFYTNTS